VQTGRMSTFTSQCRGRVTAGCTNDVALNSPSAMGIPQPTADDGSCTFNEFERPQVGETGVARVTDAWQQIELQSTYSAPIVQCGVITRESTTQAIVRVQNLRMDDSGRWSFEVKAEFKSCHFGTAAASFEQISFLVVEAGISLTEGWQAGRVRVYDREWHRVSLLHEFQPTVGLHDAPVVITQVQTYDNRTSFVTARNTISMDERGLVAFFVQATGEGVWCLDGDFYAEYFDSIDLTGSPLATLCEPDAPSWRWHSCCEGVPPALLGHQRARDPTLFSARWTTRIYSSANAEHIFTSFANRGSRVIVDGSTIVDSWSECCTLATGDPLLLSAGVHTLMYEYRSGYTTDYLPDDSYALLSWTVSGHTFGAGAPRSNITSTLGSAELFADVGWLARERGSGKLIGHDVDASVMDAQDVVTTVEFDSAFRSNVPHVFASVLSQSTLNSHLRLIEATEGHASIGLEFDACGVVFADLEEQIGWIIVSPSSSEAALRVEQHATQDIDVVALLEIGESLRLPSYFYWRNGSDPCRDNWPSIECRTDSRGTPRVIALDIHDLDLTGHAIPWASVARLSSLEELSMWNTGLSGVIDGPALCQLAKLQVLVLSQNEIRGTVPECIASSLPHLHLLWLNDNSLHGPLAELSVLGLFLKELALNLQRNRWAPLLATEKRALHDISAPLGLPERDRDWDFGYSYQLLVGAPSVRLTAERVETYRQWSTLAITGNVWVELPFELPWHSQVLTHAIVGPDGKFLVGTAQQADSVVGLYVGVGVAATWPEARDYCRLHHYDLASIHSAEDNAAVVHACPLSDDVDWNGNSHWRGARVACWIGALSISELVPGISSHIIL
jgi:hypothetical protein